MKPNRQRAIYIGLAVILLVSLSCQLGSNPTPEPDLSTDWSQFEPTDWVQYEPTVEAQPVEFEPVICFDNLNTSSVSEFPDIPPTFTLTKSWRITSILVMHWNHGQGAAPGDITLMDDQGNAYGSWQAEGVAPEPEYPNTYWRVRPNLDLPPGTYIIYDSDPATQSYNEESGNMGMARVLGIPLDGLGDDFAQDGTTGDEAFNVDEAGYPVEDLVVAGVLSLPEGSALSPSALSVATLTGLTPVGDDGSFASTSVHAPGAPQLAMALNEQGNPVLMGMYGAPEMGVEGLSVESTARAFVLFDMAVLTMPPEQRAVVASALDGHSGYYALQDLVSQAILADPVDPLGDSHSELYEQAASITAEILSQTGNIPQVNMPDGVAAVSFRRQSSAPGEFVDVEDDKEYGPQVILVNKTWAYYRVQASVDGQPWNVPGESAIYLSRNNLYGTASLEWPPVSYRSVYAPKIGDGLLAFNFSHDKEMTILDMFLTTASTGLGIGEAASSHKHLKLMLSLKGTFADGIRDIMQNLPQGRQMTYLEAAGTYSWAIGYNGGKLLLAVAEAVAREEIAGAVESGVAKRIFKFVVKKLATPLSIAYGSADMAALVYSYNSAPDTAYFSDEQRFGIYPAVKMVFDPPIVDNGESFTPITFTLNAARFPIELDVVNYTWDFGDGSTPVEGGARLEGHAFTDSREHTFPSGSHVLKVTAFDVMRNVPVAQGSVPVTIGENAPQSGGGGWMLVSVDRTDSPQYVSDPASCYATPVFGDTSFQESFGCYENTFYNPYDVSISESWTAMPEKLSPGETFHFSMNANVMDNNSGLGIQPNLIVNFSGDMQALDRSGSVAYDFIVPDGNQGDRLVVIVQAGSRADVVFYASGQTRTFTYEYRP